MFKQISAAVCIALILGLLAAGCGGGDEGPTREAFIAQADAVCFKANSKTGSEIFESYESPKVKNADEKEGKRLEVTFFVPILAEGAKSQHDGIAALDVPSGEEEKVETLLKAYEDWLTKVEDTPSKVVVDNDIYNHARELAGKMGLAKCEQTPYEQPYAQAKS